ncbi:hypothetical protein [Paraburkholderia sp.]|uniref:hypothetical protein n=1 Tax=Paraburkholderia sp. TaxID=1926495 RepID=UPI003D6DCF45
MRLAFRIDLNTVLLRTALYAALTAGVLPSAVYAQDFGFGGASGAGFFAMNAMNAASVLSAASVDVPATIAGLAGGLANSNARNPSGESDSTAAASLLGAADAASMNDIALDDQVLSRQRGGAAGMVMVAATPQLTRGNSVTLWDEIAPPAPLPIPVDAARTAQANVASFTRK